MSFNFVKKTIRYIKTLSSILLVLLFGLVVSACTDEDKAQKLFDSAQLEARKIESQSFTYSKAFLYSDTSIKKINNIINNYPDTVIAKQLLYNEKLIAGKKLDEIKEINKLLGEVKERETDLLYLAEKVDSSFEDIDKRFYSKIIYAVSLSDFGEVEKSKAVLTETEKIISYLIDEDKKYRFYQSIADAYIKIGELDKANNIADEKFKSVNGPYSFSPPLSSYLAIKTAIAVRLFKNNPIEAKERLLDLNKEVNAFNLGVTPYSNRARKTSIINAYINIGDKASAIAMTGSNLSAILVDLTKEYISDGDLNKASEIINKSRGGKEKAAAMIELSKAYIDNGENEKAAELLLESYKAVNNLEVRDMKYAAEIDVSSKAQLMTKIAGQFLRIEDRLRFSQVFDRALEIIRDDKPYYTYQGFIDISIAFYKSGYIEDGERFLAKALEVANQEPSLDLKGSANREKIVADLELLNFKEALFALKDLTVPVEARAYSILELIEESARNNQLDITSLAITEALKMYNILTLDPIHQARYFVKIAGVIKDKNIELTEQQERDIAYLLINYFPLKKLLFSKGELQS